MVRCIGLRGDDYLPYNLRRGGATYFYQRHGLGRTAVQGRWRDQTIARVYVDDEPLWFSCFSPPTLPPCKFRLPLFGEWLCQGLAVLGQLATGKLAASTLLFVTLAESARMGCTVVFGLLRPSSGSTYCAANLIPSSFSGLKESGKAVSLRIPLVSDFACKGVTRAFLRAVSQKRSFGSPPRPLPPPLAESARVKAFTTSYGRVTYGWFTYGWVTSYGRVTYG